MTNTSVLPSLLLGVLTVVLTLFLADKSGKFKLPDFNLTDDIDWVYVLLGLSFFIAVLGGRYFFKRQTSEFYAEYSLSGQTFSDNYRYIAYAIWKECYYISSYSLLFLSFSKLYARKGHIESIFYLKNKFFRWIISTLISKLDKNFMTRNNRIQWIDHMIVILAKDMRVPPRRLSDYLFQFSPDIFVKEVRSTISIMQEILSICENTRNQQELIDRRLELANSVVSFKDKLKERRLFQFSLIKYKKMHSKITGMSSSGFGLSSVLESYCMGLQSISKANWVGWSRLEVKTAKRLMFLYHKRTLHPGFDIHALLLNFTKIKTLQYEDSSIEDNKLNFRKFKDLNKRLYKITKLTNQKIDNLTHPVRLDVRVPTIKNDTDSFLYSQRQEVSKKFFNEIVKKIKNFESSQGVPLKKVVMVTQGYSGVVNKCLHDFCEKISELLKKEPKTQKLEQAIRDCDFHIFILHGHSEIDDSHKTISRYVLYKFADNPDLRKFNSESRINVKLGKEDWLSSRYHSQANLKLLISGAEFIQINAKHSHLDKGGTQPINGKFSRFINNEGVFSLLNVEDSPLQTYEHIVLAEDFKVFPHNIYDPFIKKAFNSENLEYINLYKWSQKRSILTPSISLLSTCKSDETQRHSMCPSEKDWKTTLKIKLPKMYEKSSKLEEYFQALVNEDL